MTGERFDYLLQKYKDDLLSEAEWQELRIALKDGGNETELENDFRLVLESGEAHATWSRELEQSMWETILTGRTETQKSIAPVVPIRRPWIWRSAVAAVFLIGIGTAYILFYNKPKQEIVQNISNEKKNDIKPGTNGAILILNSGEQIILDSAKNGTLARQGTSNIIKQGDQLSYSRDIQSTSNNILYNTIITPRGRQYPNLVLADGSKVWLDAGSSIRFPTSFTGIDRKVEITGQVWFSITHNEKMPFKVVVKGTEIQDLGTEFNVNAYDDETDIKVTLLQGSVKIRKVILKPSQQAQIKTNEELKVVDGIDIDQVMAWKNGNFSFKDADIKTVMRQLSRWYNIDVSYEGSVSREQFSGKIGRNLSLRDLLDGLAQTRVHYRIEEDKKVVILP